MKIPSFYFDPDALKIKVTFDKDKDLTIDKKDLSISYFSSGPGGQHANRHMNGVRLIYPIPSEYRRSTFKTRELIARSIRHRHREQNLKESFEILFQKIKHYFYIPPLRKKTRISKSAKEKRLKEKKRLGLKKQSRSKNF